MQALNGAPLARVQVAGITIAARCPSDGWTWTDRERFGSFLSDDVPDVSITGHVGPLPDGVPAGDLVRSIGGVRNVYLDEDAWTFEFCPDDREIYPERPPHQVLVFDRSFAAGDLCLSVETDSEQPALNMSLFLSELLRAMLPFHGGVMVHSCGISDDGRGIVFAGPSGAGKSTMAGLWKWCDGARVLNDDQIILRRNGRQWWTYPVPAVGQPLQGSPEGVSLEAVFLLSHGDQNTAERMKPARGASSLLPHFSLPSYDVGAVNAVLQLLDDLVNEVPVYRLDFLPDQAVVGLVRETVRQRDTLERAREKE
jgi:hypothetical protein